MNTSRRARFVPAALLIVIIAVAVSPAWSATCNVPSPAYHVVQAAEDHASCTEIVLSGGYVFGDVAIDRSLTLKGQSSSTSAIVGQVTVQGTGVAVTIETLRIEVPEGAVSQDGLVVSGGAEVTSDDLRVISTAVIFADGFERGDETAWSISVP